MSAITIMAMTDPSVESQLLYMALGAVLLGFSSATQDISIDAYRIEAVDADMQAIVSSGYMAGYRIGMIVAGSVALFIASYFGTSLENYEYTAWKNTYHIMSLFMLVGILGTLLISEPIKREKEFFHKANDYFGLLLTFFISVCAFILCFSLSSEASTIAKNQLSEFFGNRALSGFIVELVRLFLAILFAVTTGKMLSLTRLVNSELIENNYISPIKQFFDDYGRSTAWLLLALVGLYRISDIVLGVIANVFYQDMGFTLVEIAASVKSFGLVMTLIGGFVGGVLAMRYGVMRILFLGALLVVVTNLMFVLLFYAGHSMPVLYLVVSMDNLVAGISSAAFIAFLSSLVNVKFTAMQYAIFSSFMTLIPKILAGYSGSIVDSLGYVPFFIIASCIGLPILILVYLANRKLKLNPL